jgi:hypothetical protein
MHASVLKEDGWLGSRALLVFAGSVAGIVPLVRISDDHRFSPLQCALSADPPGTRLVPACPRERTSHGRHPPPRLLVALISSSLT